MKKGLKQLVGILTAATLACGAVSFSACGTAFTLPQGAPEAEAEVTSNGGFVVEKGDYFYFINGVETYTSNNDYGTPEKGALMRIKKEDAASGKNSAETVIPSLMVAGDYSAGLFIYGDRVYYATPNNMKNTSGVIENTYLDFKSAKLDGSDIKDYFYVADNTTQYRYVEVEGTVYLMYAGKVTKANSTSEISALLSYNTATGVRTELACSYREFAFNSGNKTDPWIYYTMSVTDKADSDGAISYNYQQIYRVRADWTADKAPGAYDAKAPYKYTWDQAWLDENNAGVAPYSNLGEIVLDGMGMLAKGNLTEAEIAQLKEKGQDGPTQFNHSWTDPAIKSDGYTYTLRSYTNDGVYFVRTGGQDGYLYYLPVSELKEGWDSVAGNTAEGLDIVANATDVGSKATGSALYFMEEGAHHYLYVNDAEIRHVTVGEKGAIASELTVAYDVSGATLKFIDAASDSSAEHYKYVYFTKSNGSGTSVERAVYSGDVNDYKNLSFDGEDNAAYKSVKLLDLQHATGWFDYEVVDGVLFYADAATVSSVSYNYVNVVDLNNGDGTLKNNAELAAFNEKYEEIMGTKGLVTTLSDNDNSKLSSLISYYFKTGSTAAFDDNLAEAKEHDRAETYLYTADEQTAFTAFAANEGDKKNNLFGADDYKDENGKYYRTLSYFTWRIGKMTDEDAEEIATAWRNTIQRDTVSETEETAALADWAIALIVIACVLAVGGGVGLTLFFVLRKRKKAEGPAPERMDVDTTDDKSINVYTPAEEPTEAPAEEPEEEAEAPEEPAEEPTAPETPTETPAETSTEPPAETPTETPAETTTETPTTSAETPADNGGAKQE